MFGESLANVREPVRRPAESLVLPHAAPPPLHVDCHRIIRALADALDMVGVDDVPHCKRVAIMVLACANALGWSTDWRRHAVLSALIHDCGVSVSGIHLRLLKSFGEPTRRHCLAGAEYLVSAPPLADFAKTIRHHHTPWSELPRFELDERTRQAANLINLCDRYEVLTCFFTGQGLRIDHRDVIAVVTAHRGQLFSPDLVDALVALSGSGGLTADLDPDGIEAKLDAAAALWPEVILDVAEVRSVASLFGRIVDAKSRFTAEHSAGVARLAARLARRLGLSDRTCAQIEIAGLLHDVGKLRVPDEILDKPGPLTVPERQVIMRHAADTAWLLRRLFGDHPLVDWAAWHHECPNGQGYPFGLDGSQLPIEARVIAVADVFQSVAQDRPYRSSLAPDQVAALLEDMADQGRLDPVVVEAAVGDFAGSLEAALGPAER
ncbi:MAG: HD domain-containing protein [Azospirillum sp.]|nr:HD domain-containing protein [Azospirillum sp.]